MASSSDGNERLSENTTTNTNTTTTVTLNASNLTPFVLSSDQAATQPQIIATPKGGFTASDLKMLIGGGGSGLTTDEGQIKTGLKSTASSKINLQHLPLNTTSIVKTTTPNLASPVSNTNISNIYNLMLNQQQQQSIVGLNMNTGGVAAGAKPATILSQPNLPIVTTTFMPNLNGNGGNNGGGNNGGKTGNGSSNNKIVISNNGSGASPRIITTTTTSTEGVNLPRSMPSSLKSSITTTSPNPGLNLKAMSPLSFDPNKNKPNNTPANKPMPTQTQTIQLINNIVNFPPGPTPAQMMASLQQQQTQQIKNALHNKQMQPPNHLIIPQIINQMSQQQPAGNPQQPAAAIRMIDTNIAAASAAAAAAAAAAAFMNNANIMNNLNEIQQQHNVIGVSPSSSPLKPNIIRKSRKDSPSHTTLNLASLTGGAASNNNSNNNSSDQIFTLTQQHHTNLQNQIFYSTLASNKHSIFELNQESIKTLAQSVSNNSLPVSLANALVGINSQTLSAMTAAIAQNQAQSNQAATNTTPATLTYSLAPSNVLNPSEMNKGENKPSSEEQNEANNDDRASTSSSPSSKTTSARKKRKQEFKILDFNVGFSENPLAVKRPHMNDYSSSSPVNNAATSGSSAKVHVSSFADKLNKHGYDNHQYSRRDIEQENAAESELKKQQQQKMLTTTSSKQQTQSLKPQQHAMKIDANNSSKLVNNFAIPSTPVTLISEPPTIVGSSHQDSTVSVKTEIEEEEDQEEEDDDSFSEGFLDDETVKLLSKDFCYITSDGVKWVSKRPRHSLSTAGSGRSGQQCPHVCKYSEISQSKTSSNSSSKFANPSKTVTLGEFEKNLNHWKLFYLTSQINNHIEYENESMNLINEIDQLVQQINIDGHNDLADITFKVNESIKANNQRHKSVNEQLDESRLLLSKLIGHKNAYKNEVARPKKSSSNIRKSSSSSSASSSTLSLNSISNSNALSTKLGGRKSTSTSSMLNKIHRLKK